MKFLKVSISKMLKIPEETLCFENRSNLGKDLVKLSTEIILEYQHTFYSLWILRLRVTCENSTRR